MKECKIIGFKPYDEKDENKKLTGKKMLRIIITIDSTNNDDYVGRIPVPVYLEYNEDLVKNLEETIKADKTIYYKTEENILTGKTRVSNLIFSEII